jgi:hypothetical protein
MNNLRLIALALLASFMVSEPVWAQVESPQPSEDLGLVQSQADELQINPAEPLQVTEQERDQFFTPAPAPRPIRAESGSSPQADRLIQPPPGSQTPGQMTPGQRLSIPLR